MLKVRIAFCVILFFIYDFNFTFGDNFTPSTSNVNVSLPISTEEVQKNDIIVSNTNDIDTYYEDILTKKVINDRLEYALNYLRNTCQSSAHDISLKTYKVKWWVFGELLTLLSDIYSWFHKSKDSSEENTKFKQHNEQQSGILICYMKHT